MEIKAVLFDCDGLMFETEIIAQQIWREEAAKYNVELPEDFFVHITGSGGPSRKAYLESIPGMKEVQPKISSKRFNLDFWRSIHTDCLNKTGLIELFDYLKEHQYHVAICSSSAKEYVEILAGNVSKPLYYEAIIGGNMVSKAKPDPEIFLTGAKVIGVDPENCLVLEDSKQGILAAKAAGMHSCFIKDTIDPDEEMLAAIEFRRTDLLGVIELLEGLKDGMGNH